VRSRLGASVPICSPTQAQRLPHPAHDQGVQNAKRCAGSSQAAPAAAPAFGCSGIDGVGVAAGVPALPLFPDCPTSQPPFSTRFLQHCEQ